MPAYYTIVQYVPDPVSGERINIGVVVLAEERVYSRFLSNWKRAKCMAAARMDIESVVEFAKQVETITSTQQSIRYNGTTLDLNITKIENIIKNWCNVIQFTPLRWAALSPEATLETNFSRYICEAPKAPRSKAYTRYNLCADAANLFKHTVFDLTRDLKSEDFVKVRRNLCGSRACHTFDVQLFNEKPLLAAQTISFYKRLTRDLDDEIRAIAFDLIDVRDRDAEMPLSVVVHTDDLTNPHYLEACDTFTKCEVSVLKLQEIPKWLSDFRSLVV